MSLRQNVVTINYKEQSRVQKIQPRAPALGRAPCAGSCAPCRETPQILPAAAIGVGSGSDCDTCPGVEAKNGNSRQSKFSHQRGLQVKGEPDWAGPLRSSGLHASTTSPPRAPSLSWTSTPTTPASLSLGPSEGHNPGDNQP